jgi:hypothetical protein
LKKLILPQNRNETAEKISTAAYALVLDKVCSEMVTSDLATVLDSTSQCNKLWKICTRLLKDKDKHYPNKKLSTCVTISTLSHPNSLISDHDKFKSKALHMQV